MKYAVAMGLFLLCAPKLFSQHASVSISNDFKIKESDTKNQTITHSIFYNDNFYTVTNSAAGGSKWVFSKLYDVVYAITVTRYDKDMNKVVEVQLENGQKDFGPLMPSMIYFNNKLYIAYFKSADKASFNLYLARLDENDLSLGDPVKLSTIQQENVGIADIAPVLNGLRANFTVSPDNVRLLVVCKSAPGKLQTIVLDTALHVMNKAVVPVNLSSFDIASAVLTNENGVCLALVSPDGDRLLGIGPDGKKTESRYGNSGAFAPINCFARLSRDGKSIFIFGTANNSTESPAQTCGGFMVSKLDPVTFKLLKPFTYSFDDAFLQTMVDKGGGIRHKKINWVYNFSPELLEMDNGDVALVGSPAITTERVSQHLASGGFNSHTNVTTTLTVGPVIVLFPDGKGKTFEHVIIPRQIELEKAATAFGTAGPIPASAPGAPSLSGMPAAYIATPVGNEIVIVYNDNIKNLAESEDARVKTTKSAGDLELAEAAIDKDRKLEYRKLVKETDHIRATFYLGDAVPTNTSSIVFPIGREGRGFNALKTFYTNWCFLEIK